MLKINQVHAFYAKNRKVFKCIKMQKQNLQDYDRMQIKGLLLLMKSPCGAP